MVKNIFDVHSTSLIIILPPGRPGFPLSPLGPTAPGGPIFPGGPCAPTPFREKV